MSSHSDFNTVLDTLRPAVDDTNRAAMQTRALAVLESYNALDVADILGLTGDPTSRRRRRSGVTRKPALPDRRCEVCSRTFAPAHPDTRTCCRTCSGILGAQTLAAKRRDERAGVPWPR